MKPRFLSFYMMILVLSSMNSGVAQELKKDTRAVIQEINAATGTITVILTDGTKSLADRVRTFNLDKPDLPVTDSADKPRKLTDLQEDDRVFLKLRDDDVVAIRLAPPVLHGTMVNLNSKLRTFAVRTKIGDKAVVVPATAKVYDTNQPARFEDLKAGAPVVVVFAPDQHNVTEVRVGKTTLLPLVKLTKGTGFLLDVDPDRHVVQIVSNTSVGDTSFLREIPLSKDASVGLLYKAKPFREVPLKELARGVKVQFWIDTNTRKLAHVEVEMPILGKRVVKAIDRERKLLTLADADGGVRTLLISPKISVRTAKANAKIEDVLPSMVVTCALSADRRTVEVITIVEK